MGNASAILELGRSRKGLETDYGQCSCISRFFGMSASLSFLPLLTSPLPSPPFLLFCLVLFDVVAESNGCAREDSAAVGV